MRMREANTYSRPVTILINPINQRMRRGQIRRKPKGKRRDKR
jgi:hypothetical protein